MAKGSNTREYMKQMKKKWQKGTRKEKLKKRTHNEREREMK